MTSKILREAVGQRRAYSAAGLTAEMKHVVAAILFLAAGTMAEESKPLR
jgi:hypothetical protein